MLSEQVTQLLTAYVDGEISQRQRQELLRILHESSEAREMLVQLQENAHKIKQLPQHKVEPSLVEAVLQAIAEQKAQPKPPTSRRSRRAWLPYVAATMAASLLIAVVGIFAWKAFKEPDNTKDDTVIVKGNDKKPEPHPAPPTPAPKKTTNPLLAQMVEGTFDGFAKTPIADQAFSATFAELNPDGGVKVVELAREINRDPAVHLDITVKNNVLAMARLKDVLKNRGITLVTDQSATKSLADKNQGKVEYLVYAESLTSDELTKLMGELSQSYTVGMKNNQRTEQSPYQKVAVAPISQAEKQKAKQVGIDLDAKGKETKSEAKRLAVVLPTAAGAQPSAEVRQFVNQRRPLSPGAVQVLIKIRQE